MDILSLDTPADIEFAREAILQFRTNLNPDDLVQQVSEMIKSGGFELACIASEDGSKAAAFIGFRAIDMLRTGKMIYIDDLFTLPEYRGRGYAGKLLEYVDNLAMERDLNSVHLDSGFPLHPAHRLYLNSGYFLACHHFTKIMKA